MEGQLSQVWAGGGDLSPGVAPSPLQKGTERMPLSEQELRRIHAGHIYIRDFDCLNGFGDDEWPHDFDRCLTEPERILLARACELIHGGGCHEVHTDTMPPLNSVQDLVDWLASGPAPAPAMPKPPEVHLEAKDGLYVTAQ